jgi:outer membrane protein assembly factor BamB
MLRKIVISILLALTFSINAQVTEDWSSSFEKAINWQMVTALGNYIVQTNSGLYGIDNQSGEIIWHNSEFSNLEQAYFTELDNSPFAKIETRNGLFFINTFDGAMVFSSTKSGIHKVKDHFVLYRSNSIIVSGKTADDENTAVSVDIGTGKVLWRSKEDFGRIVDIVELSDSEMLGITLFKNIRVNSRNGEIIWSNENSEEAKQLSNMGGFGNLLKQAAENMTEAVDLEIDFALSESMKYFVIGTEQENDNLSMSSSSANNVVTYTSTYQAYDISNGEAVWKKPVSVKGRLGHSTWVGENLLILPFGRNNSKVNLIDIQTGEGLWGKKGKGVPIKGGIYSYTPTGEGMLVITTRNDKHFLNYLDTEKGVFTFDKTIKVKGYVGYTLNTDHGILYATENEMNIVNTSSGELFWDSDIKCHYSLIQRDSNLLYYFNNKTGAVAGMDLISGQEVMQGNTSINFKEGEGPSHIEIRENGIFLSSDQNFAMYDFEGTQTYQAYYPSPREEGWKRALLYAGSIYSGYVSAVSGMASGAFQSAGTTYSPESVEGQTLANIGQSYGEMSASAGEVAGLAFNAANKRFKATQQARDYVMVLTKSDTGIELAKINKDTGISEKSIFLGKNRKPNYAIDMVEGMVFLESENTFIKKYNF